MKIQEALFRKNWKLEWNARSSNLLTNCLAKMTVVSNCNLFFDFNLAKLPGQLKDILIADIVAIQVVHHLFLKFFIAKLFS